MYRLIFDNGHGIDTPGKRSPDGRLLEWSYTREIVKDVADYFQNYGIPVEILVEEEKDITLPVRCARVNSIVAEHPQEQCLLVSVHVNAAGHLNQWLRPRGWQVHVGKNASNASRVLASNFTGAARELGAKVRVPTQKDLYWENNFYILTHTKCPAVLTENFFLDNKEDVEMLLSEEGKALVENIHIVGISKYLNWPYSIHLPGDIIQFVAKPNIP